MSKRNLIALMLAGISIGTAILILILSSFTPNNASKTATTDIDSNVGPKSNPLRQPSEEPSPKEPIEKKETFHPLITYSDKGFSPGVLRVPPGTTVTFINTSERDFWPVSSKHPTHNDLPGFNAGKAIAPGSTYEYTFNKKGTWGYHDDVDPSFLGVVVVESE